MDLTASERSSLIRLASTMLAGAERRVLLAEIEKDAAKYPQCRSEKGMAKVRCLIRATVADARIDEKMKRKRLFYLKTLNRRFNWGSQPAVVGLVDAAVQAL
jgi:hypothetical protein